MCFIEYALKSFWLFLLKNHHFSYVEQILSFLSRSDTLETESHYVCWKFLAGWKNIKQQNHINKLKIISSNFATASFSRHLYCGAAMLLSLDQSHSLVHLMQFLCVSRL